MSRPTNVAYSANCVHFSKLDFYYRFALLCAVDSYE